FYWRGVTYFADMHEASPYMTLNHAGCDSVVTLHLTVNHSVTVYDSLTLASEELPYNYYGNTVNIAGDYTFDGTTAEGCDSTTLLHVEVLEDIDLTGSLADLKVFPNPTRGTLTIDADDVVNVEVFDITGRKIATFEGVNTFDITNLSAGTYTLRIETTRGKTVRRIVKK
ncbi:MAG: T9SS type A sorting domain-containing protein, partial [Bacteroidales bacterium]|nr:T9SS type A sorting domain-containing protein [Bacteroidales bacterium]